MDGGSCSPVFYGFFGLGSINIPLTDWIVVVCGFVAFNKKRSEQSIAAGTREIRQAKKKRLVDFGVERERGKGDDVRGWIWIWMMYVM